MLPMKTFRIALTRTYLVTINAENEFKARLFSEYYLGNSPDLSDNKIRREKNFYIENIKMVYNEAQEI